MPTLEVPRQKVQPIVTPARQLPPGAFQAEARALQGLGEAVRGFGRELESLSDKIMLAEEQDQFDDGILEYAKFLDDQDSELSKNRDYTRETFEKGFDEGTAKILTNTKSKGALKRLNKYFVRQRIVGGIRTETKIHRLRVAEARLKIPIVVNEYAQKFVDDETPEGQKQTLNSLNEKLNNDVTSGVLSEAEAQDVFRRFTMMAVREHAENDPKRAADAVKSRSSLKELGLTKEMIASLSAEDLDALQKDAKSEIEGRSAEIAIAEKVAVEEADDEYRNAIIKGDFSDATRLQIINDQRFDNFGKEREALLKFRTDWIKSINDYAGKIATPLEKSTAEDDFKDLVDRGSFAEAEEYYAENAGIFSFPELSALNDYLKKAKTEPKNPLLADSIAAAKRITQSRKGLVILRDKKEQLRREAEIELEGIALNAEIRKVFEDPKLTPKQQKEQVDALLLSAQEVDVPSLLDRIFGFYKGKIKRLIPPLAYYEAYKGISEMLKRPRKIGEEDLSKMTEEELEAIIRGE